MNFKTLLAGAILTCSSLSVLADPFYINVGSDFGGNANPKAAGATTTGWLDEMSYNYRSNTQVAGPVAPGSAITTTGGWDGVTLASVSTNAVSQFDPAQGFTGPSANGFGVDWGLTFDFNLAGTLIAGNGTSYNSGDIRFFYYPLAGGTTVADFVELFTISVSSTSNSLGGQVLNGEVSSVAAGSIVGSTSTVDAGDVFNFATGTMEELLTDMVQIVSSIDYNTDFSQVVVTDNGDGTSTLTGIHNGSIRFAIPEPASIAVLGLGLLGLAGASRRRKS